MQYNVIEKAKSKNISNLNSKVVKTYEIKDATYLNISSR